MESIPRFSEEQQRFLIRQAAEQTEICGGGDGRTVSRLTFSIDPSVGTTVSMPWPRLARAASRLANAW
jgi:hypothetical protein